jgi:hypothetical protein
MNDEQQAFGNHHFSSYYILIKVTVELLLIVEFAVAEINNQKK